MRISFLLFVLMLSLISCRSGRRMTAVEPAEPAIYDPVEQVAEERVDPEPESEEINVIEESFAFERKEDEAVHEINRFFIILGSFRVKENADRFRIRLAGEGFDPVILLSETGLNRVSVGSYSREADARQRVLQIRRTYPQYHDTWLLIRR